MTRTSARVPAAKLAQAMEEIVQRSGLEQPYTLYRHVAARAGVHATTLLRYVRGDCATADVAVYQHVEEILDRVRAGEPLPFESRVHEPSAVPPTVRSARVSTAEFRRKFDALYQRLGAEQRQPLYRELARRIGMHPTSVLRYYRGDLRTAPRRLVDELDTLAGQVARGETRPLPAARPRLPAVRTQRAVELLDCLVGEDGTSEDVQALETRLKLEPHSLQQLRDEERPASVPAELFSALDGLVAPAEYDPCRVYRVGERVRHHLFGLGKVVRKIHKDKVMIEFAQGPQRVLSEAVNEDPYRLQQFAGGGSRHDARTSTYH